MTAAREVFITGIGFWASRLPGWDIARQVFRGEAGASDQPLRRPAPTLLPPAERRRAPDTVAVALEVAASACRSAEVDPASLSTVFTSTHGDLVISDALCDTLAKEPALTSPTRFHNSVHNAAAGYWTIGTGCMKPYTALSAYTFSFAAGFLESVVQVQCTDAPVLFVAYDIEARGPAATMQPSRGVLGVGLVLAPKAGRAGTVRARWRICEDDGTPMSVARAANATLVEGNAMAPCLPFFEALADGTQIEVSNALGNGLSLRVALEPI